MAPGRPRGRAALPCLLVFGSTAAASILAATPVRDLVAGMTPAMQIPEITAMPAFHSAGDLRKRDFWYECGFCCGTLTLSCNNGEYCKVTETLNNAYGYCSTIDSENFYLFTAVADYTSGVTTCGPGTLCCDSTVPSGLKWVFEPSTVGGFTTTMYGCATSGLTTVGTAAADFVTDRTVPLESVTGTETTFSLPSIPLLSTGTTGGATTTVTDQATSTNAQSTSGSNSTSNSSNSHSDTAAIAGGVAGGVVFLLLCAGLGFWLYKRHQRNRRPSHIENMSTEAKARTNLLNNVGPQNKNQQPPPQQQYQQYHQQGQWQQGAYEMNAQPNVYEMNGQQPVYEMNGQQPMHEMSSERPLHELGNDRGYMR